MPEIAEVSRLVHFLRLHLVGKKIANATAIDDSNVFGKVGTTGKEVQEALEGKTVTSAGSQGKYFWVTLDKPPHLVMHLGMTGWVHIKDEQSAYTNYYKKLKEEERDAWPPKYWKFTATTTGSQPTSIAFTDSRRFGRVRLVECPADEIRSHSPLKENGPDPVVDKEVFTVDLLRGKMRNRHVPIKALLLDQTAISGIGNWVADETLYQARFHPEQYCDTFSDDEVEKLHWAIRHVCQTAVDKLADSDQFPEDWLFKHRWGKGGKGAATHLPNGEKLAFLTVGGRTSCFVPERQKKTGTVEQGAKVEMVDGKGAVARSAGEGTTTSKKKKETKRAAQVKQEEDGGKLPSGKRKDPAEAEVRQEKLSKKRGRRSQDVIHDDNGSDSLKKSRTAKQDVKQEESAEREQTSNGRRRSTRVKH